MKAVEVVWYDAFSLDAWMSANDMASHIAPENRGQLVRTRGWLYSEDEWKIVLAMTIAPEVQNNDEESVCGIMVIPRGMVLEVLEQGD